MWLTPKTDWQVRLDSNGNYIGDYFEAKDYQRIKGNLQFLIEIAQSVFTPFQSPEIPDVTETSFAYVSYINALEQTLEAMRYNSFDPGIGETKTWYGNSATPTFEDLNRIERACLLFYNLFEAQIDTLKKLSFEMGGSEF